jgi:hypothetical protein
MSRVNGHLERCRELVTYIRKNRLVRIHSSDVVDILGVSYPVALAATKAVCHEDTDTRGYWILDKELVDKVLPQAVMASGQSDTLACLPKTVSKNPLTVKTANRPMELFIPAGIGWTIHHHEDGSASIVITNP